jgi:hypothetical protein
MTAPRVKGWAARGSLLRCVQWRRPGVVTAIKRALNDLNLVGKATLNVFKPGGCREISAVGEERLHVCHEYGSFTQEIARLCQLRRGGYV